ncbi:Chorismate synthase [uncultured archaeon]|nr:Chorismate synthase [uncultured archaeon]
MDSLGRIFRTSIFGESHGKCVGVVVDGCPAGIPLREEDMFPDLERRKSGAKGTTPRKEADAPLIMSGVFNGKTTGAPIMVMFENRGADSPVYEKIKSAPRPGHADLVAMQKFGGFSDYRGGGHFSGRLTLGIVAAGVIAKKILGKIKVDARVVEAGGATGEEGMRAAIESALAEGDSIGGILECRASGVPCCLGEPFFDSLESLVSHAVFSIPSVKGVEFGAGFRIAKMRGSEASDAILNASGKTESNNNGGVNGGISNGNEIFFRVAIKPASSTRKAQKTFDLAKGDATELSVSGRHDACIALRAPVIVEAATSIVLADLMLLEQNAKRVRGD